MNSPKHFSQVRACVDIPALPLQIVLQQHPDWKEAPVAIIREDRPLAPVLWINSHAQRNKIQPGMTYSAALAICSGLRTASILSCDIEAHSEYIIELLRRYSDQIEPAQKDPGTFWLSTLGLDKLHPSLQKWGEQIRKDFQEQAFATNVVIGYRRFATYALARSLRPGVLLIGNPQEEQVLLQRVRLESPLVPPELNNTLQRLGVQTFGAFLSLPADEVRTRLGEEAHQIYQWAQGDFELPLQPQAEFIPVTKVVEFDFPEESKHTLLFTLKKPLRELLLILSEAHQKLESLHLCLEFECKSVLRTQVRPAEPTLEEIQLIELLRLHLDTLEYPSGINRLELRAETQLSNQKQLPLFQSAQARDLSSGNRALARIRAEWGEKSVVHASLKEGHLPEAQFYWAPHSELTRPHPSEPSSLEYPPLVRRLYQKPQALSSSLRITRDESWLYQGYEQGTIINMEGPYVLKGGWWLKPIHREYHFATTQHGRLLWIYYDRQRRRWFIHGEVE